MVFIIISININVKACLNRQFVLSRLFVVHTYTHYDIICVIHKAKVFLTFFFCLLPYKIAKINYKTTTFETYACIINGPRHY